MVVADLGLEELVRALSPPTKTQLPDLLGARVVGGEQAGLDGIVEVPRGVVVRPAKAHQRQTDGAKRERGLAGARRAKEPEAHALDAGDVRVEGGAAGAVEDDARVQRRRRDAAPRGRLQADADAVGEHARLGLVPDLGAKKLPSHGESPSSGAALNQNSPASMRPGRGRLRNILEGRTASISTPSPSVTTR